MGFRWVFLDAGNTLIGLIKPQEMLAGLSQSPDLLKTAEEVELATIKMVDEAK